MSIKDAHLNILPELLFIEPALSFVLSYAQKVGVDEERVQHIYNAIKPAVLMVIENHQAASSSEFVTISISESNGRLIVKVLNKGVPILPGYAAKFVPHLAKSGKIQDIIDKFSVENLGREGQAVTFEIKLGKREFSHDLVPSSHKIEIKDQDIVIRTLNDGEEGSLSQLFYFVYGYNYINEFVYYPEKIKKMIQDAKLISVVGASPNGRLLGHVGLIQWNSDPPVYEPCLGVTDPTVKARGLFRKIFQKAMEKLNNLPMQYCFFDFVTNHDYSQRLISRYGTCDMALFIGCQTSKTQAKLEKLGIGKDPVMTDRYTILYSVIHGVKYPFGKEVLLPNNLGEVFGFLLKPLNAEWVPASRFSALSHDGSYQVYLDPVQNAVVFDCVEPGIKALKELTSDWRQLMKDGYQYAAVEVSLEKPGMGQLHDMLAEEGFFASGFVPYHKSDKLGFRFQALAPTKVDFSEIKVYSKTAKKLLELIKNDYERKCFI